MKDSGRNARVIWETGYPLFVYMVVFQMSFFVVTGLLGDLEYMLVQTIVETICLPLVVYFYQKMPLWERKSQKLSFLNIRRDCAGIIAVILLGSGLNNLIALTSLAKISDSYQRASHLFYGGSLLWEILAAGILAPLVEEIMYRGVVLEKLKNSFGGRWAVFWSAFLFGAMHLNLVQFCYAFLMGLLLGYIKDKTESLYLTIFCHMGINVVSLLSSESGLSQRVFGSIGWNLVLTGVMVVVGVFLLEKIDRKKQL